LNPTDCQTLMLAGIEAINKASNKIMTDDVRMKLAMQMPVEFGRLVYESNRLAPGLSYIVRDLKPFTDGRPNAKRASENIRRYLDMRFNVLTWDIGPIGDEVVEIKRVDRGRAGAYNPHGGIVCPSGLESFLLSRTIQEKLGYLQKRIIETRSLPRSETIYGRVTIVEKEYLEILTDLMGGYGMSNLIRAQTVVYNTFQPDIIWAQESIMGRNNPNFEILLGDYHHKLIHAITILMRQLKGGHYIDDVLRKKIINTGEQFQRALNLTDGHIPDGSDIPFTV